MMGLRGISIVVVLLTTVGFAHADPEFGVNDAERATYAEECIRGSLAYNSLISEMDARNLFEDVPPEIAESINYHVFQAGEVARFWSMFLADQEGKEVALSTVRRLNALPGVFEADQEITKQMLEADREIIDHCDAQIEPALDFLKSRKG